MGLCTDRTYNEELWNLKNRICSDDEMQSWDICTSEAWLEEFMNTHYENLHTHHVSCLSECHILMICYK